LRINHGDFPVVGFVKVTPLPYCVHEAIIPSRINIENFKVSVFVWLMGGVVEVGIKNDVNQIRRHPHKNKNRRTKQQQHKQRS